MDASLPLFPHLKTIRTDKRLENLVSLMEMPEDVSLGFISRSMVCASMPHAKVNGMQYVRETGPFTLTMTGHREAGGVPYGVYPRLILCWLCSEIVKTRSRDIYLGDSLSDFMKKMNLHVTGGRWGTLTRFKEQLRRLFSAHISLTYKENGQYSQKNILIADKVDLFWNPNDPQTLDLFKSHIRIGETLFDDTLKTPIPVDIRAIQALKSSGMALDIYFWLTYRMSYLKKPVMLSYDALQAQFGAGYNSTSHARYEFKRKFRQQLKNVLVIYPDAHVEETEEGFCLKPGKPHVKKIARRG
jgi:hypothetical protein